MTVWVYFSVNSEKIKGTKNNLNQIELAMSGQCWICIAFRTHAWVSSYSVEKGPDFSVVVGLQRSLRSWISIVHLIINSSSVKVSYLNLSKYYRQIWTIRNTFGAKYIATTWIALCSLTVDRRQTIFFREKKDVLSSPRSIKKNISSLSFFKPKKKVVAIGWTMGIFTNYVSGICIQKKSLFYQVEVVRLDLVVFPNRYDESLKF